MRRVGVYIGLLILSFMFPAIGFAGSMGMKISQSFGANYGSSRHGHYGMHIHPSYRRQHFVKHRPPKHWSPRFVKCYYPRLGIWRQDYNSRRSITIEQINIIISPNSQFNTPKSPTEKKSHLRLILRQLMERITRQAYMKKRVLILEIQEGILLYMVKRSHNP
jgi:hypothetical protein